MPAPPWVASAPTTWSTSRSSSSTTSSGRLTCQSPDALPRGSSAPGTHTPGHQLSRHGQDGNRSTKKPPKACLSVRISTMPVLGATHSSSALTQHRRNREKSTFEGRLDLALRNHRAYSWRHFRRSDLNAECSYWFERERAGPIDLGRRRVRGAGGRHGMTGDDMCPESRTAASGLVKPNFKQRRRTSKDNAKLTAMPSQGGSAGSNPVRATSLKPSLTR